MSDSSVKQIFLIRHAHSIENQRIASMFNCLGDLKRFSLPTKKDVGESLELLNITGNHDAPLSDKGLNQCQAMKDMLRENTFVSTNKLALVIHSPLQRAKQTCQELIGCSSDEVIDITSSDQSVTTPEPSEDSKPLPEPIRRVLNLSILEEKSHSEWVFAQSSYEQRVAQFQKWLGEQPESIICVVGHSQYFKTMLGLPFKFDNVDVYSVLLDPQKTTPNEPFMMEHDGTSSMVRMKPEWHNIKLLHTCNKEKSPADDGNDAEGKEE